MSKFYLIWSFEHNGWWKWGAGGYTSLKAEAGVYTGPSAHVIVSGANAYGSINEALVPCAEDGSVQLIPEAA